jgi:hypothetical protein
MKPRPGSLDVLEQEVPKATEGGQFGHRGSLSNFLPGNAGDNCPGFMKYSG